ncbi:cytochrome P450 [Heliocybe sulcata]|uniref:Cytochrome P450 n=1 Tax=Heliocybe sulcata TaxID=5364 RepID=A0A5C3MUZ3_9AGAM|nr:cytochrome P450 [Heliocybe sulcata]
MIQNALFLVLSILGLYGLQLFIGYRQGVKNIGNHPGYRTLISGSSFLGNFLPPIPGIAPGRNSLFRRKHEDHAKWGWDVISTVSAWPRVRSGYRLADAAVIKEVTSARARFPKPVKQYSVLTFFGRNIVASEGEEWKRYRKITAPSFSERNNKLVWDETCRIMMDMFDNVWQWKDEISVDHCVDLTLPIALFVIGVAGFGRRISWNDDMKVPAGHKMTFKDALHIVSTDVFLKLIVPKWAMGWTERFRNCQTAFEELREYMLEMIRARRTAEKKEERYDLFSSLLDASEDDSDGEAKLADEELLGNIFIFLVAGHETTAHTLCYVFGLLALYQDEQEILYQHIKSVIPDGRIPTYEEMNKFTQSMAVFYETLRLYPPVPAIPKQSAEDTTLTVSNAYGEKTVIPVPAGTDLVIATPALHYNPRYWEDPHAFKPARFLEKDWPRDAFLPFSAGARACIGRRFFETEGIAILTMLVAKYKIEVKEEPQFAAETFEQRRERLLANRPGLTLTPLRVPLVFKRRV